MQLVASGAQDVYLTGDPQITFFKALYRRHTNFSIESIEQTLNGKVALGNKVTCTVSRNGDLIHRVYLEAEISGAETPSAYGHILLQFVEVEIGGQRIDLHTGEWLHIWNELTQDSQKQEGYNSMIGNDAVSHTSGKRTLYVPLQFWFCRNAGAALPLIALQYHEVKINLKLSESIGQDVTLDSMKMFIDYIYLDTDERRRFAQASHEYLIDQLQINSGEYLREASVNKIDLTFNHPVKSLFWVVKKPASEGPFAFRDHGLAKLQLNGHDRFSPRDGKYFSLVQPYQHMPKVSDTANPIHVYSFGLKPAEHQPSGSCNMSRIDNATLSITTKPSVKNVIHFDHESVTYTLTFDVDPKLDSNFEGLNTTDILHATLEPANTLEYKRNPNNGIVTYYPSTLRFRLENDIPTYDFITGSEQNTVTTFTETTDAETSQVTLRISYQGHGLQVGDMIAVFSPDDDLPMFTTTVTSIEADDIICNLPSGKTTQNNPTIRVAKKYVGAVLYCLDLDGGHNIRCFVGNTSPKTLNQDPDNNFKISTSTSLQSTTTNPINSDWRFDSNEQTLNVYALNQNVLRIMSGMGGLAFSN